MTLAVCAGKTYLEFSLSCFADFSFDDLEMTEQEFEDYKSKYLDIYEKVKGHTEKTKFYT